jgi:Na+-translocating ferredoxin:NAD+ oxidoreductase RnfC subunit
MKNIDQSKIKVSINFGERDKGIYIAEYKGEKAYADSEQLAKLKLVDKLTYPQICNDWEEELKEELKIEFNCNDCTGGVCPPSTLERKFKQEENDKIRNIVKQELRQARILFDDEYEDDEY